MTLKDQFETNNIRFLTIHKPSEATGKLKQIYAQVDRDFMLVAPFTLHAAEPDLVAAVWSAERETMLYGLVPRAHKEAVVSEVAKTNQCPFCVSAHTLMMAAAGENDASQVVYTGKGHIADELLRQRIEWGASTRTPDAEILHNPPFNAVEAPEIIGGALAFHYINRMVSLFIEGDMMPNMGLLNGFIRNGVWRFMMKSKMEKQSIPGDSLQFLPEADLPDVFDWAKNHPHISRSFAGITATHEKYAQQVVSPDLLAPVQAEYDRWSGEDTGISRKWLAEATTDLSEADRSAASMMLLAGFAPYQVTESDINAFREHYPDDRQLLAVTGWGAWAAVRRISTWIYPVTESAIEVETQTVTA